jgi:hypothetical protein
MGSLKIERVKYGHEFRGTKIRVRLRWRGPTATVSYRPVLSLERPANSNKYSTV